MKKILIADDQEPMRRLLKRVLEQAGYEVVTAEDGLKAISVSRDEQPDLVLMDLEMPGGLEATRRIRAVPGAVRIPIIALTEFPTLENVKRARDAGASDLLSKVELHLPTLLERVQRALPKEKAAQAPRKPESVERPKAQERELDPTSPLALARERKGLLRPLLTLEEVEDRLKKVLTLKALPFVAQEIIEVTSRPGSGAEDLADTLGRDQALTARVLQLANSAFYALHGRAKNLTQAVARIGFRGIRELALAITLIKEFRDRGKKGGLPIMEFWKHSLACAVLAKDLATVAGSDPEQVEEAFLGGLLHDVGKAILNDHFHEEYREILAVAGKKGVRLLDVEREGLGVDHTDVAKHVIAKWALPVNLGDPIVLHHTPWTTICEREGADLRAIGFVWVANVLTKAARIGSGGDETLQPIPNALMATLGLTREKVFEAVRSLNKQVGDLTQILLLHGPVESESVESEPEKARTAAKAEILLLHEIPPLLDPVEVLLDRMNYRVRETTNLEQAWKERRPEIVVACPLSDLWMEGCVARFASLTEREPGPIVRLVLLTDLPVPRALRERLKAIHLRGVLSIPKILQAVAPAGATVSE